MSRSFKKLPNENAGTKMHKVIQGKRLRRINHMRVDADQEPHLMREIINKYDIKDYNWTDYEDRKENAKHKRK